MLNRLLSAVLSLLCNAFEIASGLITPEHGKVRNMPTFTPSALVDQIRGSLGGATFSTGKHGAYIRRRVAPSQPQSGYSATARNLVSVVSKTWSTLTASKIAGWNKAAEAFSRTNKLGQRSPMTGFNLFCMININLLTVGEAQIDTVPVFVGADPFEFVSLTAVAATHVITLTIGGALAANMKAIVMASPGIPKQKALVQSQMRMIEIADTASTAAIVLTTPWFTKFPEGLVAGQVVHVGLRIINTDTGEGGKLTQFSCVAS